VFVVVVAVRVVLLLALVLWVVDDWLDPVDVAVMLNVVVETRLVVEAVKDCVGVVVVDEVTVVDGETMLSEVEDEAPLVTE